MYVRSEGSGENAWMSFKCSHLMQYVSKIVCDIRKMFVTKVLSFKKVLNFPSYGYLVLASIDLGLESLSVALVRSQFDKDQNISLL